MCVVGGGYGFVAGEVTLYFVADGGYFAVDGAHVIVDG